MKISFRQAVATISGIDISTDGLARADFSLLCDQGEIDLIKLAAQFPRVIEAAAQAHEPHRLAFYLHDLASTLHSQWTRGKDQPQLRFLNEEAPDLTVARLGLIRVLSEFPVVRPRNSRSRRSRGDALKPHEFFVAGIETRADPSAGEAQFRESYDRYIGVKAGSRGDARGERDKPQASTAETPSRA